MNPYDKDNLISLLEATIKAIREAPAKRECKTCIHYQINVCKLVDAVPPAHVVESGCEKYELDPVPF